ncbi:OLC1v1007409C1 [Oldenlandia corymbosa var. corymbosa]|uniref:OLC1v1007409C1 n=1 Tax=Oldenlandia corymbosa var. corymbosa TaxID=529605 RepID=A0AAV1DKN7_OLDCO|nr:OLC1v1007409C1 [Oldenlandia corymbosa var. corymbosa]
MPPAAGVVAQSDRVSVVGPSPMLMMQNHHHLMQQPGSVLPGQGPAVMPESFAKDAIIAWFRGEFAAANAIIDALCGHLKQLDDGLGSGYESVFAAIHRRRLNWIPILQMQKYYSIADVAVELRKATLNKKMERDAIIKRSNQHQRQEEEGEEEEAEEEKLKFGSAPTSPAATTNEKEKTVEYSVSESEETSLPEEEVVDSHGENHSQSHNINENGNGDVVEDSPESEITDTGSQEVQFSLDNVDICSNHEGCEARREQIKITKGFIAKEPLKGHMVNVVRGLKLYEEIFNDFELSKLNDFVNELRVAGRNGELSGETFILYNQQVRGNKRELIQLGVPIFGPIKDDANSKCRKSHIEPIPAFLQGVIDHLIQWHIFSENRKPNGCIINYFDEDEYSQPFMKPPHLDQPICTLVLSQSTMAFGRTLVNNSEGNYRGPLMLSLKEGSLLVMRGNSADVARHVMCTSPNKRVSITFFKIRMEDENTLMTMQPANRGAMTVWQPGVPTPNGAFNGIVPMDMVPKWGAIRTPVVMLAPLRPMVMNPRRMSRGGTGVFLPWTVGSRRPARHLPPRAQKSRLLALPSSAETRKTDTSGQ